MPTATTLERPKTKAGASNAKSVVIIGAGPGGLAAAMLLAKGGMQVTVLERLAKPGGRCSSIEADGFKFDIGRHSFSIRGCWIASTRPWGETCGTTCR